MKTIAMPFHRLMALSILVTASGCIAYPTQMPDEEPFTDEWLPFIEIGTSTKEQVATVMSNFRVDSDEGEVTVELDPHTFRGGDWWLFAQTREEFQWVYADVSRYSDTYGDVDYHFLLIKFDEHGVVSDYEISSLEADGCNREGVCKLRDYYMLLATEDDDNAAKTLQPRGNQCVVYLYLKKSTGKQMVPVKVSFDDGPAVVVGAYEGYLQWDAEYGHHEIELIRPTLGETFIKREIDCQRSEHWFFEYSRNRSGSKRRMDEIEGSRGRREINKRRLVVMD